MFTRRRLSACPPGLPGSLRKDEVNGADATNESGLRFRESPSRTIAGACMKYKLSIDALQRRK